MRIIKSLNCYARFEAIRTHTYTEQNFPCRQRDFHTNSGMRLEADLKLLAFIALEIVTQCAECEMNEQL